MRFIEAMLLIWLESFFWVLSKLTIAGKCMAPPGPLPIDNSHIRVTRRLVKAPRQFGLA